MKKGLTSKNAGRRVSELSSNQKAQLEGDTAEQGQAKEIRDNRALINTTYLTISYNEGQKACTAERIAKETELPEHYIINICGMLGHVLK